MAYGARLESVLGESPRGFESPILRDVMSRDTVPGNPREIFAPGDHCLAREYGKSLKLVASASASADRAEAQDDQARSCRIDLGTNNLGQKSDQKSRIRKVLTRSRTTTERANRESHFV